MISVLWGVATVGALGCLVKWTISAIKWVADFIPRICLCILWICGPITHRVSVICGWKLQLRVVLLCLTIELLFWPQVEPCLRVWHSVVAVRWWAHIWHICLEIWSSHVIIAWVPIGLRTWLVDSRVEKAITVATISSCIRSSIFARSFLVQFLTDLDIRLSQPSTKRFFWWMLLLYWLILRCLITWLLFGDCLSLQFLFQSLLPRRTTNE